MRTRNNDPNTIPSVRPEVSPVRPEVSKGEPRLPKGSCGFTLLEVLVATLILGTAIVAVIQSFSVGLKARAVGAEYEPAVSLGCWIAETRFLQVPLEQPLGMDKGYQWSWKATPIKREGEKDDENAKKVMQALSCEVRWSSGNHERLFKIHTLEVHRK